MATQVSPLDNPEAWDVVSIGGKTSPGIVKITGAKRANRWDVKDGGGDGATATFKGFKLAEPVMVFTFWKTYHLKEWADFVPLLKFDPLKGKGQAFDVFHPALEDSGIKSCVVQEIGSLEFDQSKQWWTREVKLLEYRPPPKNNPTKTPAGSASLNSQNTNQGPINADDAQQQEIAKNNAVISKMPSIFGPFGSSPKPPGGS